MFSDHGGKSVAGEVNPLLDVMLFMEKENQEMQRYQDPVERRVVKFFREVHVSVFISSLGDFLSHSLTLVWSNLFFVHLAVHCNHCNCFIYQPVNILLKTSLKMEKIVISNYFLFLLFLTDQMSLISICLHVLDRCIKGIGIHLLFTILKH